MMQIAVVWDGDSGEFVPLISIEEIDLCTKSELPAVRWNGHCYEQLDIDDNWCPVVDNPEAIKRLLVQNSLT